MPALSPSVTHWSTRRGRANEFTPVEAGEGELELNDRDGAFDPTNPTSPNVGQLQPLKQVQISWPHPLDGSGPYDIFTGYVEDWNPQRVLATGAKTVVPLIDGFELLSHAQIPTGALFYAPQHVDARIHAALTDVGWSPTKRRITTGNVNVQGITYDVGAASLEAIQDAGQAEFPLVAMVFMDKSGNLTFTGRGVRFGIAPDPPWVSYPTFVKLWRVGDDAACEADPSLIPITSLDWSIGVEALYNDITCAYRNATDAAIRANHISQNSSIEQFGVRSLSLLDLPVLDGSTSGNTASQETNDYAVYFAENYQDAHPRINTITFRGQMDDGSTKPGAATVGGSLPVGTSPFSGSLWNFLFNVELNHVLEVHTMNPGGGGFTPDLATKAGYFFVEGIANDVTALNESIPKWEMTLSLSPMAQFAIYRSGGL